MNEREFVRCAYCGAVKLGRECPPTKADGSALRPIRHRDASGRPCPGSNMAADLTSAEEGSQMGVQSGASGDTARRKSP